MNTELLLVAARTAPVLCVTSHRGDRIPSRPEGFAVAMALAAATATFADGRVFREAADATPGNINAKVRAHMPRMALTRAKARCLRDALGIGMCSVEEVE